MINVNCEFFNPVAQYCHLLKDVSEGLSSIFLVPTHCIMLLVHWFLQYGLDANAVFNCKNGSDNLT